MAVTDVVRYAVYKTTENNCNLRTNTEKIDAIERQVKYIRTELKDAIRTSEDIEKSLKQLRKLYEIQKF